MAVVESNCTIPALVVTVSDPEAAKVIDIGLRRSQGDQLGLLGYDNGKALAATIQKIVWLERRGVAMNQTTKPTVGELVEFIEAYPTIHDSVRTGHRHFWRGLGGMSAALASALHWMFGRRSSTDADEFIERVGAGTELHDDHPLLTLRLCLQRVEAKRNQARSGDANLMMKRTARGVVLTWNAMQLGQPIETSWTSVRALPVPEIVCRSHEEHGSFRFFTAEPEPAGRELSA